MLRIIRTLPRTCPELYITLNMLNCLSLKRKESEMKKTVKKIGIRTLSVILSVLMVMYVVPTTVFASPYDDSDILNNREDIIRNSSPFMPEDEYTADAEYENKDMRQANVKYFVMDDGSYTMAV